VQAGLLGVLSRTFEDNGYALSVDPSVMPEWEEAPPNDGAVRTLWDEYDSLLSSPFPCKATLKIPLQADPKTVEDGNAVEIIVFARANADALARIGTARWAAADVLLGVGGRPRQATLFQHQHYG
jgi:hypothetical protein